VETGDDPRFGPPAAVYFANLLAHERAPDPAAGPSANEPPMDQDHLRTLEMENEIANWRAIAESCGADPLVRAGPPGPALRP
jgi:hypothetical protein